MLGSCDKFVENKYKAGKKKPLSGCSHFLYSFIKSRWLETPLCHSKCWNAPPINPPVSCSLSSLALQTRQLSNYDIRIFKHALGKKGSFPLRKNCDGHNSYISSLRKGNTRASTFPNAGPSTQSQLSFLRQRHNDIDGMVVVAKLQDSINRVKFRHSTYCSKIDTNSVSQQWMAYTIMWPTLIVR